MLDKNETKKEKALLEGKSVNISEVFKKIINGIDSSTYTYRYTFLPHNTLMYFNMK